MNFGAGILLIFEIEKKFKNNYI